MKLTTETLGGRVMIVALCFLGVLPVIAVAGITNNLRGDRPQAPTTDQHGNAIGFMPSRGQFELCSAARTALLDEYGDRAGNKCDAVLTGPGRGVATQTYSRAALEKRDGKWVVVSMQLCKHYYCD